MRILRKLASFAPALALLGAFLLGVPGAGAQEREPMDLELSMTNRYPGNLLDGTFEVSVKNNSPVTVRNIRVQFEVDELTEGRTIYLEEHEPSSSSTYRNDGLVNVDTLEWVIPELRGGLSATTRLNTDQSKNTQTTGDQQLLLRLRGSIVESSPPEAPGRLGNNQARTYLLYAYTDDVIARTILITSLQYGVDADPDADTFTVKVRNRNRTLSEWNHVTSFQHQLRVRVTPSPGLRLAATAPSGTSFNPSTGIWDIGTLNLNTVPEGNRSLEIRVTGRDARAGPPEDQCLTVEIEHIIPDLEEPYLPETACMSHKALLLAGDSDLFTMYDCVSKTDYPCGSQPSLELVAVKSAYQPPHVDTRRTGRYELGEVHRARFRSDVVGPGNNIKNMVLQPEEVVVQVPYLRRYQVKGGTEGDERWRSPLTYLAPVTSGDGWKPLTTEVSDVSPKQRPGSMQFMVPRTQRPTDLVALDPDAEASFTFSNGLRNEHYIEYYQFDAMGTYRVQYTIKGTKDGTEYTDSATYTFHVGPVAELEVKDDPDRSLAQPGQRAYTIAARNQGPDTAPAVQVTLAGVPDGAEVIASKGEYDPDTGIWTIGEMLDTAWHVAQGRAEGEVLTIIPPSGGDPITATIENNQDYSVVIDGTTHTAKYYDYLDHNNEATIALSPAPRAGPPGRLERPTVARLPSVPGLPAFALVRWAPMAYLNGFRVSHYEVQRSSSPWETEPFDVKGPVYLDMGLAPGQRAQYRVRAVNEAGGHGPWSLASARATGGLGAPNGLMATPGVGLDSISLSWFAPSGESGSLTYRIEHALDGAGPWTRLSHSPASATTYSHSHSSLLPGTTHYYRVATVKGSLVSAWAYAQATMPAVGADGETVRFDPPLWPENLRFTSIDRTAVTLAWDPPANDGGSRITGYEYRVEGPCEFDTAETCDIFAPTRVGGTTTSRGINLPNREGTYTFWVRALNAAGASDWSQGIQKKVGPATASGGRVIISPTRLTVPEGGEATYKVRVSTNPTHPIAVFMHWNLSGTEDEALASALPPQQGIILLPTGYDLSGLPDSCDRDHGWKEKAHAWNVGVPITVKAPDDDEPGNGRLTITHELATVLAECLNNPANHPDSVYDGMSGPALTVTERDND